MSNELHKGMIEWRPSDLDGAIVTVGSDYYDAYTVTGSEWSMKIGDRYATGEWRDRVDQTLDMALIKQGGKVAIRNERGKVHYTFPDGKVFDKLVASIRKEWNQLPDAPEK